MVYHVSATPGLAVLGFIIWERRWKELWQLPWIPLAVALAVIAPWAVAVHRAEPDYWRYFVVVEHLQRFLSKEPGQHPEPFWFLVPFLVGGIFPAAFLALEAVPEDKQPSACVGCRSCEQVCPQQIKVSEILADFTEKLKA